MCPCRRQGHISMYFSRTGTAIKTSVQSSSFQANICLRLQSVFLEPIMVNTPFETPRTKHGVTLRSMTPADENFLCQLYASTREEELAVLGWSDEQKDAFLAMQFNAQHKFYLENFTQADFHIMQLGQDSIGRLYLDYRKDEIRIIDIALLPQYRNKGIGSAFIKDILAEAAQKSLAVRIHVEHYNRALALYKRLGFRKIGDEGVYYLMEWTQGSFLKVQ